MRRLCDAVRFLLEDLIVDEFFSTVPEKQLDWLATNTDDITSQSHSLFACSREQIRQVENRLKGLIPRRRKSSREIMSAKYGWLHMGDSFEFSHAFRFRSE